MTTKKPSGLDAIAAQKEKTTRRRGQFPTDRARPSTSTIVLPEIPETESTPTPQATPAPSSPPPRDTATPKRWKLSGPRNQIAVSLRWRSDLNALLGDIISGLEIELGVKTSRRELIEAYVVPALDGASPDEIAARVAEYRRDLARENAA